MSKDLHPKRSLRKLSLVGTLLSVAALTVFCVSTVPVTSAHALVVKSGGPPTTPTIPWQYQTNMPANPIPGHIYSFTHCIQPPSNVDHATFTDAQLMEYGMPVRSYFSTAADFDTAVRAMKHRDCQFTVGAPGTQYGFAKSTKALGENSTTAANWGGYYEYAGDWTAAETKFYMPAIVTCNSSTKGRAGDWAGVGGVDSNSNLVQAGATSFCEDNNFSGAGYQMWVDNDFAAPTYDTTNYPKPGDEMDAFSGGQNGCNFMNISDISKGYYFPHNFGNCPGNNNYFECMQENGTYNGVYRLADDGSANFFYCEGYDAVQSNWLVMGNSSSSYWDVTMRDNNQSPQPFASTHSPPNTNGQGNFTVTYKNNT